MMLSRTLKKTNWLVCLLELEILAIKAFEKRA